MKVCIQIDSSFDEFLNKVGQLNNASCGKVCRLIIEHQLTFYLNRKVIPSFYPGVFADFKKLDVPGEVFDLDTAGCVVPQCEEKDDLFIPEGMLLKEYLELCHVSSYNDLSDDQRKEFDDYCFGEGKYSCRKALRK